MKESAKHPVLYELLHSLQDSGAYGRVEAYAQEERVGCVW